MRTQLHIHRWPPSHGICSDTAATHKQCERHSTCAPVNTRCTTEIYAQIYNAHTDAASLEWGAKLGGPIPSQKIPGPPEQSRLTCEMRRPASRFGCGSRRYPVDNEPRGFGIIACVEGGFKFAWAYLGCLLQISGSVHPSGNHESPVGSSVRPTPASPPFPREANCPLEKKNRAENMNWSLSLEFTASVSRLQANHRGWDTIYI